MDEAVKAVSTMTTELDRATSGAVVLCVVTPVSAPLPQAVPESSGL
jgi:hypothetical protein